MIGYDSAIEGVFQHVAYYGFVPSCFTHSGFSALAFKLFLYLGKSVARKIHFVYELYRFRLLRVDNEIHLFLIVGQKLLMSSIA